MTRPSAAWLAALAVAGTVSTGQPGERVADAEPAQASESTRAPAMKPGEPGQPGQPGQPRSIPRHWRELPELGAAARAPGTGDARSSYRARAWGDPASGVFLMVGQVEFPGRAGDSAQRSMHQAMESALTNLGMEVNGVSTSMDQEPMLTRFALRRGELVGQARLLSSAATGAAGADRAAVGHSAILVACFHNQREPVLAERLCGQIVREQDHDPIVQLLREHDAMDRPMEEPRERIDP